MTVSGVSLKRSIRTAVLAATLASAAFPHALVAQPAAASRPVDIAADIKATLLRERDAVVNQVLSQADRDEAARRLLSHQTGDSRNLLLNSGINPGAKLAVARALKDDPAPDPVSIGLLTSLLGSNEETTVAAARALAAADNSNAALPPLLAYINDPAVHDTMRAAAARGLGASADVRAARALGTLLDDKHTFVRSAACDALTEMTGLTHNGRDADAWKQWVQNEAGPNQTNPTFRDHLVDLLKRRQQPMPPETMELLESMFLQLQPAQRAAALNTMLKDPQPSTRIVGIRRFEHEDPSGGIDRDHLAEDLVLVRNMIGDTSPAVRQQAAKTLGTQNQKDTAEALMTQLAMETEPAVKVEIIHALATGMGDLRVVPQLLQLLKDPSPRVRMAAADALRTLSPAIKPDDALTKQVNGALQAFITDNQGDVKAAGVEALVPFADPNMLKLFSDLAMGTKETAATRRAALSGLKALGDHHAARTVIDLTDLTKEKDESVRLAALDAFSRVGTFDYHDSLYKLTKPSEEPDASVRGKAWEVFKELLPTASPAQLQDYAELFRKSGEMDHRLAVLQVQADLDLKNADKGTPDQKKAALADLAAQRENIGAALVQLHQPKEAVEYFKQALDYWLQNNPRGVEAVQLIQELMNAYLDSKLYTDAAKFADATIARSPEQQQIVASLLANRAQDLLDPPEPPPGQPRPPASPRDAQQLASEALKTMNLVALDKVYRNKLQKVLDDATARLAGTSSRPSH